MIRRGQTSPIRIGDRAPALLERGLARCASCSDYCVPPSVRSEVAFCAECRHRGRPADASDPYDDVGGSG